MGSNPGSSPGTAISPTKGNANKPMPNTLDIETMRLQKIDNMKDFVLFKKQDVEYESETIELYEMISEEFDYDLLRK